MAATGLLPMAAMMMGLSPFAPGIATRIGLDKMLTAGAVVLAAGFVWMAFPGDDPTYWSILPGLVLTGLGVGLAMSPATTAITESLPADKQGVASALNDTVRELGGAIGVALIGSVLAAGYRSGIADTAEQLPAELGHVTEEGIGGAFVAAGQLGADGPALIAQAQQAFLDGWSGAMWLAAGIAIVTAGVAAVLIPAEERVA